MQHYLIHKVGEQYVVQADGNDILVCKSYREAERTVYEARQLLEAVDGGGAMTQRNGFKQLTLQDRLSTWAEKTREQVNVMEPGSAKEALLKKVEQAESAAKFEAWSRSAGLQRRQPK
jgi:hypothetical protein